MKFLFTLLIATLTSGAFAAPAPKVDTSKSKVNWFAKKVVGNDSHKGFIPLKSAQVSADKAGMVTGGTFVFDMNGFETTDLTGKYKTKFENHLKSADFFDVSNNQTAKLVISSVDKGMAKGKLTLKGVEKDITLKFKKAGMAYEGSFNLDRTLWGIKYGSNKFFKGLADKAIADTVKIDFNIMLVK